MSEHVDMCSLCGRTEQVEKVDGQYRDHNKGWIQVSVSLRPVLNNVLCPDCADPVLAALKIPVKDRSSRAE